MRARLEIIRPSLVLVLCAVLAPTASAGPWLPAPGGFQSDFRGEFFSTQTAYDNAGERPRLAGGGTYESRSVTAETELGWRRWASLRFAIPFESVTFRTDPNDYRTQSGMSDLLLGLKLGVVQGPTALALEVDWEAPLGYNRRLTPSLGAGIQNAVGRLSFGTGLRAFQGFFQASGGYRYRIERYDDPLRPKDEAFADADLGFWIGRSLLVAGDYEGLIESSDAALPITLHQAGPRLVYRVDDGLDVIAGSLHTFAGENALHADRYYVAIAAKKTGLDRLQGFLGGTRRP